MFSTRFRRFEALYVKKNLDQKFDTLGVKKNIFQLIFIFLVEYPTKYMTFMAEVDRNRRWSGPFALFSQIQRFRKNVRSFF